MQREDYATCLRLILPGIPGHFTKRETKLILAILARTLRFGKLIEEIPTRHFLNGISSVGMPPTFSHRNQVYLARGRLLSKGLLAFEAGRCRYAVAVPFFLARVVELAPVYSDLLGRVVAEFDKDDFLRPLIPVRSMDDIVRRVGDMSDRHMKKQATKITPAGLRALMQRLVAKHWPCGSVRYECLASDGRLVGSMRNFIRYCEESGLDPQVFLDDAICRWPSVASLVQAPGGKLRTDAVSFLDIFNNRERILRAVTDMKTVRRMKIKTRYMRDYNAEK